MCSNLTSIKQFVVGNQKSQKSKFSGLQIAEAESAFSDIKAKLSNATLLVYPTPNAETALFVDASSTSCGAVLQQKVQNIWKPLSFFFPFIFTNSAALRNF